MWWARILRKIATCSSSYTYLPSRIPPTSLNKIHKRPNAFLSIRKFTKQSMSLIFVSLFICLTCWGILSLCEYLIRFSVLRRPQRAILFRYTCNRIRVCICKSCIISSTIRCTTLEKRNGRAITTDGNTSSRIRLLHQQKFQNTTSE